MSTAPIYQEHVSLSQHNLPAQLTSFILGTMAYQQHDELAAQPLLEAGLAECRAAGAAGRRAWAGR